MFREFRNDQWGCFEILGVPEGCASSLAVADTPGSEPGPVIRVVSEAGDVGFSAPGKTAGARIGGTRAETRPERHRAPGCSRAIASRSGAAVRNLDPDPERLRGAILPDHCLPGLSHAVGDFPICRRTGGEPARSGRIPGVRSRPRAVAGAGSGPVVIRFGGLAACRRRPGAGPDAARLSGPGQGRNGLAAVRLQASPGFGEALRLAAAGEDHRERDVVQAGPVRRAVAGAGQARVLAEDAVPLAVVQVLHTPVSAVQLQQLLRRRGPGVEGGDQTDSLGVVLVVLPGVVRALLKRLAVAGDPGDLADARIVDRAIERRQDADGALLQAAAGLFEILREAAGGVPLPVDAVEDAEGLRRVALDREDIVGSAAPGDQLRGVADRGQRVEGDDLAADVAALQEVVRGRRLAPVVAEVGSAKGAPVAWSTRATVS